MSMRQNGFDDNADMIVRPNPVSGISRRQITAEGYALEDAASELTVSGG